MINKFFAGIFLLTLAGCSAASRNAADFGEPMGAKGDRVVTEAVPEIANWFTKDRELDATEGVSSDKAYDELKLKVVLKPVIVAVIDSGVDINHEDLKGHIWNNPGEIADNGIDDDKNGYVDDVHGWNFLGTKTADGKIVNIGSTTLEVTRESVRLKKLKAAREAQGESLTATEQALLDETSKTVEESLKPAQEAYALWSKVNSGLKEQYEILKVAIQKDYADITLDLLKAFESEDAAVVAARDQMISILTTNKVKTTAKVIARDDYYGSVSKYYYNENFDPRADLMHDNYFEIGDRFYGNNDVQGPDADHGTHVSGMIAANRGNDLGIDGVATDVRIMAIRAVPDGDEYDKDVANAVRYAVDNGAQVINMSFGKGYSPLKGYVDDAFRYAASKGVLIVHAAGNDSQDNDTAKNFPNRNSLAGETIPGWLEVGASSHKANADLPASFSNYGKHSVDLFAPGFNIKSSVPGNKYAVFSGTSMACPATAGVAALVLSQKALSAVELKELLMATGATVGGLQVKLPWAEAGVAPMVQFEALSISGVIANAYAALKGVLSTEE